MGAGAALRQADGWQYVDADSPSLAERTGHTAVWSHTADGAYIFGGHFYFRDQSYFTDVVFYSPQARLATPRCCFAG